MKKRLLLFFFLYTGILIQPINYSLAQIPVKQVDINLVKYMPNLPFPYKMKDWKTVAAKQDVILYDFNAKGTLLPLIWWDDNKVNFPIRSFGIYSYVGSAQQYTKGSDYEALPTMGSVLGASLIGIDKSNQDGIDYVNMCKQFFNKANGVNLIQNGLDRKPGETFWYEIWPGMAFSMVADLYPQNTDLAGLMKINAETWMVAVKGLSKDREYPDFNFTSFDFDKGIGVYNKLWHEPDASAGIAWTEYMAWVKFKDQKFLDASKACMTFLEKRPAKEGVFYEIMMPYGAYLAIRMNAELGTAYDELKMLNWCFDGDNSDRDGWGVMCERWGKYDVHGLVGQKKWEQYAFTMNTFSHAAALVPVVKYNPAYSRTIGKWILNLANASRLFYADEHPKNRQTSSYWDGDPDHVISYEGCRKNLDNGNFFAVLKGVLADEGPYGIGDQVKRQNAATDICPYGSSWVGMLASIVDTTNVEKILKLNCNATDFFGNRSFPTYLLFNPFYEPRTVILQVGKYSVNVYDLVSKQYLKKNVSGTVDLLLNEDSAVTIMLIPANMKTSIKGKRLMAGNTVIDFRYK
jgi:hypothetical protein